LVDQRSWIFYPTEVSLYISDNGKDFTLIDTKTFNAELPISETEIANISFDLNGQPVQYLKIIAKNYGDLPDWHLGAPFNGKAWLFADEIVLK
jgi:hypothetical protein